MAARPTRLKRRPEFLRVASTRKKWVTPGLIVQMRPHRAGEFADQEQHAPRVGFTASRKVGNAVERNRVKRRLRALADDILPKLASPGYDLVIIGRRATLSRPFRLLQGDLIQAIKKLGLARPDGSIEEDTPS